MTNQLDDSKVDGIFPEDARRKPRRAWRLRGSIFWPLLLITLGVILLLSNAGYIHDDPLSLVLRLWPILLIGGGVDELLKREGVVSPGFWAAAGVLLLLANLGLVPWDAWTMIVTLWPLIFVAIGLDMLFGRRSFWLGLAGLALVIAIMFGALMLMDAVNASTTPISQAMPESGEATIVLKPVIGALHLRSGSPGGDLISGTVPDGRNSQIRSEYDAADSTLTLEHTGNMVMLTPGSSSGWDLALSPDLPLNLETEMALGRADIDLTGLQVESFRLELPMGTAWIILPEDSFEGDVDLPMGTLTVVVPEGVGFRLVKDGGLAIVDVPDDYVQNDDSYTSAGFSSAGVQVELRVDTGMAVIRVVTQ